MVKLIGGDKMAAALAHIAKQAKKAATVEVGFQSEATYPDGTPVAQVAAVQEFGETSMGIPPRPFFRGMIAKHSDEWPDEIGKALAHNDYDAKKALGQIGEMIRGELQQSIADFDGVPLRPATVERKGFDKQLVDTGVMLKAPTSIVK